MSINVSSVKKTVSFRSPYTGKTFQEFAEHTFGRSGYLSGGAASDSGGFITIQPVKFVQDGIIAESLAVGSSLAVPAATGVWYVVASISDDDPNTGITFTATADKLLASTGIVVAFKANGRWRNPPGIGMESARINKADSGLEHGFGIREVHDAAGLVTSVDVYRGTLTDGSGDRVDVPHATGSSSVALSITPARPHPDMDRNDHVVLRKRDDGSSSLEYLIGGCLSVAPAPVVLQAAAGVTRPSQFAVRGGTIDQQWWAWSEGSNLRIKAGTSPAATLLVAGSAISETWVVGLRTNGHVIILYVAGTDLYAVAMTQAGAISGAATLVEALGNQISHVRGTIDSYGNVNCVFQHYTGVEEQIYFSRFIGEVANFGSSIKAPTIITSGGTTTGNNETWPSMAVDSKGQVTIANIQGTGSNEYGELVITRLTEVGDFVSREVIYAATDVGVDPLNFSMEGGTEHVQTAMLDLRKTAVVVTPHDEVYYFTLGKSVASHVDYVLAGTPTIQAESGHKLVSVNGRITDTSKSLNSVAAAAGPQGEVTFVYQNSGAANAVETWFATIAPKGLQDGRRGASGLLALYIVESGTDSTGFVDLHAAQGVLGEIIVGWMWGTSATCAAIPPLTILAASTHPMDTYIGGWSVPKAASATLDGRGKGFGVFATRPKRMNYPFLVGSGGRYSGYNAISDAVLAAGGTSGFSVNEAFGGEIVIRPGSYPLNRRISIRGGISIRGEGRAVLISQNSSGAFLVYAPSVGAPTITGLADSTLVESTSGGLAELRPGDVLSFASGFHVVVRQLGYQEASAKYQVVVDGAASGGFQAAYVGGFRLENLTILTEDNPNHAVYLENCYQPVLRNLCVKGLAANAVIGIENCIEGLLDSIDAREANADATNAIEVANGSGTTLRNISLADDKGLISIASTAQDIHLIGCKGDNTNPAKVVYSIAGGRSTPVYMSSCEGAVSGDVGYLISNMGRRLRSVEGGGALELEDDNTRDAGGPADDGIKLSSATHKKFNGAGNGDVITDAVNERVLRAGDTMTGALVFAAGDERVQRSGDTMTGALVFAAGDERIQVSGETGAVDLSTVASLKLPARQYAFDIRTGWTIVAGGPAYGEGGGGYGRYIGFNANDHIVMSLDGIPGNSEISSILIGLDRLPTATVTMALYSGSVAGARASVLTKNLSTGTGVQLIDMGDSPAFGTLPLTTTPGVSYSLEIFTAAAGLYLFSVGVVMAQDS